MFLHAEINHDVMWLSFGFRGLHFCQLIKAYLFVMILIIIDSLFDYRIGT